jgi:hypothetical protein
MTIIPFLLLVCYVGSSPVRLSIFHGNMPPATSAPYYAPHQRTHRQNWERPTPIDPDIEEMGLLMNDFRQSYASQDWSRPNRAAARVLGKKFDPERDEDLAKALAMVDWHDANDVKNAMVMVEMWKVIDMSVNYRSFLTRIRRESGHIPVTSQDSSWESWTWGALGMTIGSIVWRVMNRESMFPGRFLLIVNRTDLFQSSSIQIMDSPPLRFSKGITVKFIDEMGHDAGGLTREFLSLISRDIFSSSRRLFEPLEDGTMYFNTQNDHQLMDDIIYQYRFVGRIMGFCYNYLFPMDVDLNPALYKLLMSPKHEFDLEDLLLFDKDMYRSMKYILEHEVEPGMFHFESSSGEEISDSIVTMTEVTERNKKLYVRYFVPENTDDCLVSWSIILSSDVSEFKWNR